MAQKTITIDIPEEYDDIKFNKDTNKIEFIKTDSRPKSWEEYYEKVKNTNCCTPVNNLVCFLNRKTTPQYNEFDTKEEAQAFIALGKLIQLYKSWIGNWKPDWKDTNCKYVIQGQDNTIGTYVNICIHRLLAFPTEELRNKFLNTFRDLIEEAKYFL